MTKELKLQLLNFILKYDFFFVEVDLSPTLEKNRYFLKKFSVSNSNKISNYILNLFELTKNLKQIIRVLLFIKKRNILSLKFSDTYSADFLMFLLEKNKKILKKICFNQKRVINLQNSIQAYCFLDHVVEDSNYKKLLENNKFLITEINAFLKNKDIGVYKIFNNLKNFQKIVFFAILLKNFFNH